MDAENCLTEELNEHGRATLVSGVETMSVVQIGIGYHAHITAGPCKLYFASSRPATDLSDAELLVVDPVSKPFGQFLIST